MLGRGKGRYGGRAQLYSDLGEVNSNLETVFNTTPLNAPNTFKAYVDSLPTDRMVYYIYYIQPTDAPDSDWGFCRVARYNKNLIAVDAVAFNGKHYSMVKNNTWGNWKTAVSNTDFGNEIITAQFADGVYVRSGNIKSGNHTVITVTQKYGGVKNVTLTADLTSSGYAVYARNANDGSNYNGAISLYVFAAK